MLQIRDVMTRDVLTVTPETTLREAADLFARRHVSGAPVVVGGKVVGVVSSTDLLEFVASNLGAQTDRDEAQDGSEWEPPPTSDVGDAPPSTYFSALWSDTGADAAERFAESEGPQSDALDQIMVSELMTRGALSLAAGLPLSAAAEYMRSAGVHRVLVLEGGRLAGIITSSDVTRAVAEHKVAERRYVFARSEASAGTTPIPSDRRTGQTGTPASR